MKKVKYKIRKLSVGVLSIGIMFNMISGNLLLANDIKEKLDSYYAQKIYEGRITLEDGTVDNLLYNTIILDPEADDDNDGLKNNEELYIYTKNGKKYLGYYSNPKLLDTDGDGVKDRDDENPLVWDISARDMTMFSELSYREDEYIAKVLDASSPLNDLYDNRKEYTMMHKELAPFWKVKETYHESNGFDAVLFETSSNYPYLKNGSVQVLGIRGTQSGSGALSDTDDDTRIFLALNPDQANSVTRLINDYEKNKKVSNLYVTGHSLGGYLAQRGLIEAKSKGYDWIKKSYTFNAPKIKGSIFTGWLSRIAEEGNRLTLSGESVHYVVNNDRTTSLVGSFDHAINIGDTAGGHSSRSYFESKLNNQPGFSVGDRNTVDGTGYVEESLSTVEFNNIDTILKKDNEYYVPKLLKESTVLKNEGEEVTKEEILSKIEVSPEKKVLKEEPKVEIPDSREGSKIAKVTFTYKDGSYNELNIPIEYSPVESIKISTYRNNPVSKISLNEGEIFDYRGMSVTFTFANKETRVIPSENFEKEKITLNINNGSKINTNNNELIATYKNINSSKIDIEVVGEEEVITTETTMESKTEYRADVNLNKGSERIDTEPKNEITTTKTKYKTVNGVRTSEVIGTPSREVTTELRNKVVAKGVKEVETLTSDNIAKVYKKDNIREKGSDNFEIPGTAETKEITYISDVDPTTGELSNRRKDSERTVISEVPTIVKVATKEIENEVINKVKYLSDDSKDFGYEDIIKGEPTINTHTYNWTVDPKTGAYLERVKVNTITEKEGTPDIIIKGTKTSVTNEVLNYKTVENKISDQPVGYRKVLKPGVNGYNKVTTRYFLDETNGKISTVEYIERVEATDEVVEVGTLVENIVIPYETEYVADYNRNYGTENVIVKKGANGLVDGNNKIIKEKVNKVISVGAKPKVETKNVPFSTTYVSDITKDLGYVSETAGINGVVTYTTTYTVNLKDGNVSINKDNGKVNTPVKNKVITKGTKPLIEKESVAYETEYRADNEKEYGTETEEGGVEGEKTYTTTYKLDTTSGNITSNKNTGVVTKQPENKIITKGTKPLIEKESVAYETEYRADNEKEYGTETEEGGVEGEKTYTTTYTLDTTSGKITSSKNEGEITKHPINKIIIKGTKPLIEKESVAYETEYRADNEKEYGTETEEGGVEGEKTYTTMYTLDTTSGKITSNKNEGEITKHPVNKAIIKGTKPLIEKESVAYETEYRADNEKSYGTETEEGGVEGEKTYTTTYTLDTTSGKITSSKNEGEITKHPVNKAITKGTKPTIQKTIIPYDTITENDSSIDKGVTIVKQEGFNGEIVIETTYKLDPISGEITQTPVINTKSPINKVIVVGTKEISNIKITKKGDSLVNKDKPAITVEEIKKQEITKKGESLVNEDKSTISAEESSKTTSKKDKLPATGLNSVAVIYGLVPLFGAYLLNRRKNK